jgi:hypothetical protein
MTNALPLIVFIILLAAGFGLAAPAYAVGG